MRGTIIAVFAVVVLIVSVLSFGLMRATIGEVSNKGHAQRAVRATVAQLQVEGLRVERWLAHQAATDEVRAPFEAGAPGTRSEAATSAANGLEAIARKSDAFAGLRPTLVVFFDAKGVVLGRNGSTLMRDEKLGERRPEMMKAILAGETGSAVWVSQQHNEQMLASYAPIVRGGTIVGGIAIGTPFNDERIQAASGTGADIGVVAAVPRGEGLEPVARTKGVSDAMLAALPAARQAFSADAAIAVSGLPTNLDGAAQALRGYGPGDQAVIMAVSQALDIGSFGTLLWPVLGVFLLGMVLVGVGAHLIDNYIAQPIGDLEDGLLAVINGQTDLRFELEHKLLGGLVTRINSLLNALLNVREDDTDDEGRPSVAPSSSRFTAALNVDERMVSLSLDDVDDARRLRDEAPEDYYKRIYDEYIAAKRELGDPIDHIKFAPFNQRIKGLEQQLSDKHGKPFRYRVELSGKEVVFVAVPLA